MPGFGFGYARSRRRSQTSGTVNGPTLSHTVGALTRDQFGAGLPVTASAITSGDAGGHWTVSGGRLYPSGAGDSADLNAGPYALQLNDGSTINISVEPGTWDVTDQSEWDFVARQPPATLAGKTIALRNSDTLQLGITGGFGTPFRRADLRDGVNSPLVVKGRLGEIGAWGEYCEIDKVQSMRGARGITFQHLRTTAVAEQKFRMIGENANETDDITIDDCWIRGQVSDPNGDFSTSGNYPNFGVDLVTTQGSTEKRVGNISVTNCLIEWGDSPVNITCDIVGAQATITGNTVRYFYGDGIAVTMDADVSIPTTISDNFITDCVGIPTDSRNPHPDAIRLQGQSGATVDWAGITIERNIILEGTARGDTQGIFLDDMRTQATDSGHFFTATIRHNVVGLNETVHGVTVGQAKDCVIENNTCFSFNQAATDRTIGILTAPSSLSTSTAGGGNTVQNNIADNIQSASGTAESGNFEAGQNGSAINYPALFDGPAFAPLTTDEAKAQLNPKVAAGATII